MINRRIAMNRVIYLLIFFLLGGVAYAVVPNTFTAGDPASAAEVNENFNDLDGRVTSLENATLNAVAVDCNADGADALQTAINGAPPAGLIINATGNCNGIDISIDTQSGIAINGQNSTTITGNVAGEPGINIEASAEISNLVALPGSHNIAIEISGGATVFFSGVTATNTNANSAAVVVVDNSFASFASSTIGSAVTPTGIIVEANSTVNLEGGNSVQGSAVAGFRAGAVSVDTNAVFQSFQDEVAVANTITGGMWINFSSTANLIDSTVQSGGNILLNGNSNMVLVGSSISGGISVSTSVFVLNNAATHSGDITLFRGSHAFIDPSSVSTGGSVIDTTGTITVFSFTELINNNDTNVITTITCVNTDLADAFQLDAGGTPDVGPYTALCPPSL